MVFTSLTINQQDFVLKSDSVDLAVQYCYECIVENISLLEKILLLEILNFRCIN